MLLIDILYLYAITFWMENIKYKFTQIFKKISELVQNLKWANKRKYEKLKLFDYEGTV